MQQLKIDVYQIVERSKALVRDFLDARTPQQVTVAHVDSNFDKVATSTSFSGDTICTWLQASTWWLLLYGCSFFEHSNVLMTFWIDWWNIPRREGYLYEVVIIHKLLTEWFKWQIPNEIFMNDSFDPSQLRKLNNLWIVIEIEANLFTDDRRARIYRRS